MVFAVLTSISARKAFPMLVLTRRPGEGDKSVIKIGADIEVTVVEVHGGQVRIGITAPPNVTIHRQEVYQQIQEQLLSKNQLTV